MTTLLLEEASGPMLGRMPKDCMIQCETAEHAKTFKERTASQIVKPRKRREASHLTCAHLCLHTHTSWQVSLPTLHFLCENMPA